MSSAAEFVESGAQDACDDACSICLESFCEDDPATVTSCKHEYHLQCILEWSQRSKECPMCLQALSLKDPDSQELLKAVGRERALRRNKIRPSPIYRRSPVEEYEYDRFASYGDEDFIMQHLAAAAMGRAHHVSRREQMRFRPSAAQGQPRFVLVSGSQAGAPSSPASSSPAASPPQSTNNEPSLTTVFTFPHYSATDRDVGTTNSLNLRSRYIDLEEPGSSNPESLDTFKSRVVAASSRYKESLTKSTKGFRERFRTRGGIMQDLSARAREMSAGVVRALERMSVEPNTNASTSSPSANIHPPPDHSPGSASASASASGSSRASSSPILPSATLTPTPELRNGVER